MERGDAREPRREDARRRRPRGHRFRRRQTGARVRHGGAWAAPNRSSLPHTGSHRRSGPRRVARPLGPPGARGAGDRLDRAPARRGGARKGEAGGARGQHLEGVPHRPGRPPHRPRRRTGRPGFPRRGRPGATPGGSPAVRASPGASLAARVVVLTPDDRPNLRDLRRQSLPVPERRTAPRAGRPRGRLLMSEESLVLCSGTLRRGVPFAERVAAAAGAGFAGISMWGRDYAAARAEGLSDEDLRLMLADHGLFVAEVDPAWWWLPGAAEVSIPPSLDSEDVFRFGEADLFALGD